MQCLRMSSTQVHTNAFQAMMNLARDDDNTFTKLGACEVLLEKLPDASISDSNLLGAMLDCMYALGLQNRERQKKLEAAKALLIEILFRQYEDKEIHKKTVIIASLLAYTTDDMPSFRPLVRVIYAYFERMPVPQVGRHDPHAVDVRRVCIALMMRYNMIETPPTAPETE